MMRLCRPCSAAPLMQCAFPYLTYDICRTHAVFSRYTSQQFQIWGSLLFVNIVQLSLKSPYTQSMQWCSVSRKAHCSGFSPHRQSPVSVFDIAAAWNYSYKKNSFWHAKTRKMDRANRRKKRERVWKECIDFQYVTTSQELSPTHFACSWISLYLDLQPT